MDYINLTKFLFVLGVDLIPFFIYIGKSTKPKKGFYYLSFSVSILLITPLILQGEQPLSIDFLYYPIITINSSILSLMLIGHWFLVDPTIDRKGMKQVAKYGIFSSFIGIILTIISFYLGFLESSYPLTYIVLGLLFATGFLAYGANSSLNEKGYAGVMAATGLSYLSFITSLGATGTLVLISLSS
jgi:hypothetical protein|tara:strand:+ start:273 stop:830 length:558 start_codon:yes stop_codon:yes gene_type:complete